MKPWLAVLILLFIGTMVALGFIYLKKVNEETAKALASKEEPSNVKISFGIS